MPSSWSFARTGKNGKEAGQWWPMPFIPSIWEAEAGRFLSSRTARATQRNPVSEKPKPKNEKQKKQPKPKSIIVQGIWIGSRDIAGLLCPD